MNYRFLFARVVLSHVWTRLS